MCTKLFVMYGALEILVTTRKARKLISGRCGVIFFMCKSGCSVSAVAITLVPLSDRLQNKIKLPIYFS